MSRRLLSRARARNGADPPSASASCSRRSSRRSIARRSSSSAPHSPRRTVDQPRLRRTVDQPRLRRTVDQPRLRRTVDQPRPRRTAGHGGRPARRAGCAGRAIYTFWRAALHRSQECSDCDACVEACPVDAITSEHQVPERWQRFIAISAAYFRKNRAPPVAKGGVRTGNTPSSNSAGDSAGDSTDDRERWVRWREGRLLSAGFGPDLADVLAHQEQVDLHELLKLVDRGCPPHLAARILAPLETRPRDPAREDPGGW